MASIFPKLRPWQIVLTAFLLLADAALGTYALFKKSPISSPDREVRETRWREDLEFFGQRFPSVQVDFGKLYSPDKFSAAIRDIETDVPRLSDSEIILRLMRLVALGNVSHVTVDPEGDLDFHPYPLDFSWYSDGPALTWAPKEYQSALGARIVRIGSKSPEEMESAVAPYLSHENLVWLHQVSPDFILNREVAEHFGLTDGEGRLELTLAKSDGKQSHVRVAPSATSKADMVSVFDALHLPTPLYRKNPGDSYWYEYLPDAGTLYIQYNRCRDNPKNPFKKFTREIFKFADKLRSSKKIERMIVDLRFNSGGDSTIIDPLLQGLESRPWLSSKGHLFVLTGPGTYSSGMMAAVALRQDSAILIGQPCGSPPNEYGEVKAFTLPNSKIEIRYTTRYFRLLEDSDPLTLEPDVVVQRSISDFLSGKDQVLETALKYRVPTMRTATSR